jgi:Zn-dependent protease/CBS domain-containing protein
MIGNRLRLGRIFGIEILLDYSWFIVFVLVTWSLARAYFPAAHPGWPSATYWIMGILTSLLFFASVVFHELAHSLVSRAHGTPVRDITLFIFGGAARLSEEPKSARAELRMALAGPASSLVLTALFGLLWWSSLGGQGLFHALAGWLARINAILAIFNLIPGFPLDGGRVLRAIAWSATGDLRRATKIAAGLGQIVAFGFIFLGIWQIFRGNWADGLWVAFIGWFLNSAAIGSLQQVIVQDLLKGHTVREVMMTDCPHLPRQLTIDLVVDQIIFRGGRRCFPVLEGGQVQGLLTLQNIREVPRNRWPATRVQDVMIPKAELKAVRPDEELATVLSRMANEDVNQFPVMENGQLVGMVARDNLLSFIRTRLHLAPQFGW